MIKECVVYLTLAGAVASSSSTPHFKELVQRLQRQAPSVSMYFAFRQGRAIHRMPESRCEFRDSNQLAAELSEELATQVRAVLGDTELETDNVRSALRELGDVIRKHPSYQFCEGSSSKGNEATRVQTFRSRDGKFVGQVELSAED